MSEYSNNSRQYFGNGTVTTKTWSYADSSMTTNSSHTLSDTLLKGTQTVQMEKAFRKKFRDQSVLPLVTNKDWQGRFRGVGTEINIPVLPSLGSWATTPDATVKYQTPQTTVEKFYINRIREWGIHMIQEDVAFSDFNVTSPILDEQAKVLGEDIETEFFGDIKTKCHSANTGDTSGKAGYVSGTYAIGSSTLPTSIYKTDALAASGTAKTSNANKLAAPDFFAALAATLNEQPGGQQGSWRCIVPTVVAALLQTSELKQAELTGDATSTLRKGCKDIGNLAGMDIIVTNRVPFVQGTRTVTTTTGEGGSAQTSSSTVDDNTKNVYPIFAMDTTAISFAEEMVIKDKIQDKDTWGDFIRCKTIYDWFVRYPERFAVGYVQIG